MSNRDYKAELSTILGNMEALKAGAAGPMEGFATLHRSAVAPGALATGTKELIALAIGVTQHCDGCIAFHTHGALEAGASRQEVLETLGVAILMGGGPSMIYATHVVEALGQFEGEAQAEASS